LLGSDDPMDTQYDGLYTFFQFPLLGSVVWLQSHQPCTVLLSIPFVGFFWAAALALYGLTVLSIPFVGFKSYQN